MVSSPGGRRLSFVLGTVAVAAMAFLGVVAGNWYVDFRHTQRMERKVAGLKTGTSTELRAGGAFPDLPLVDLEGRPTSTGAFIPGMPTLVVFVSITCDDCTKAILAWGAEGEPSSGVQVIAIADQAHEYVRVYQKKTAFPFPLYCDEADRFGSEFDMNVYPTAVGVDASGRIAFVRHGFEHGYSLAAAMAELAGSAGHSDL